MKWLTMLGAALILSVSMAGGATFGEEWSLKTMLDQVKGFVPPPPPVHGLRLPTEPPPPPRELLPRIDEPEGRLLYISEMNGKAERCIASGDRSFTVPDLLRLEELWRTNMKEVLKPDLYGQVRFPVMEIHRTPAVYWVNCEEAHGWLVEDIDRLAPDASAAGS